MRKRLIASMLIVVALAAMSLSGLAETIYYGTMMVDNCEEWVSLRDGPGTDRERLAKVPLYAVVTDCEQSDWTGDFIYCNYDGQWGYILSDYLVPQQDDAESDLALDVTLNGLRVTADKRYRNGSEYLQVACEDTSGRQRWDYAATVSDVTELDALAVFLGGAAQDPMVMVYNANEGLTALDIVTGEIRWTLTGEYLGAGIRWAVDGDGNTYIGGYYGPDPVCIDVHGQVKWRSDSGDCYWLYDMELVNGQLVCAYDVMDGDHDRAGRVVFSLDGEIVRKDYE